MTHQNLDLTPGEADRYRQHLELFCRVADTRSGFYKDIKSKSGRRTTTDAYFQTAHATAELGPVGVGWGWTIRNHGPVLSAKPEDANYIVEIEFWHGTRANTFGSIGYSPCYETVKANPEDRSQNPERITRPDFEAPAKALTKAIKKALSYLGFSADIHLGCHDNGTKPEERAKKNAAQAYLAELKTLAGYTFPQQPSAAVPAAPTAPLQDFTSPSAAPRPATAPTPSTPSKKYTQSTPDTDTPDQLHLEPARPATLGEIARVTQKLGASGEEITAKALAHYKSGCVQELSEYQARKLLDRLTLET
jgi:hypothetical protein